MLPFGSIVSEVIVYGYPNDCDDLREDNDKTQQRDRRICSICTAACTAATKSGEREIPVWALIKLADYYRVSTDYLLGLTDDPARR